MLHKSVSFSSWHATTSLVQSSVIYYLDQNSGNYSYFMLAGYMVSSQLLNSTVVVWKQLEIIPKLIGVAVSQ